MCTKTYLWAGLVIVLALMVACGGGGGSSGTSSGSSSSAASASSGGGSASNSVVGSWVLVSSNWNGASPNIGFSSDGTGAASSTSFTWTQQGNQVQAVSNLFNASLTVNGNTLSWSDSNGVTATYSRA
jgi:hypothetical protein